MTSTVRLTYEDYVEFPEDGLRHEIIDGEHIVGPAPVLRHQAISGEVYVALRRLQAEGRARVLYSPIDLRLSDHDVVQPDLVAIAAGSEAILGVERIDGPPDLVVEILSPSTQRVDRGPKLDLYARAGVREYWIVDGDARELIKHVLVDGRYQVHRFHDVPVPSDVFAGFALDLPAVLDASRLPPPGPAD